MICKVSVKVVSVAIRLHIISERVKLCTIFLHLVSIFANIFRGFASKVTMGELIVHPHAPQLLELVTRFSRITSEKIIHTLILSATD